MPVNTGYGKPFIQNDPDKRYQAVWINKSSIFEKHRSESQLISIKLQINMTKIDRRKFIAGAGILAGGSMVTANAAPFVKKSAATNAAEINLETLPNFCSHEHWGSIESIGMAPDQGGFRADTVAGARPQRATSIWDLVLDPYMGSTMVSDGIDLQAMPKAEGYSSQREWWIADPDKALEKFNSGFKSFQLTGIFQCLRRGIKHLYNTDIATFKPEDWKKADTAINENYQNIFAWYRNAMKQASFSELIRPVHPEFYTKEESSASAREELSFTHTIMRIDPFLDLWKETSPRRDALSAIAGIEPGDAGSWRKFIEKIFDLAAKHNTTGIKQLQAYFRPLNFQPRNDSEIRFRGALNEAEIIAFQDWVIHECCKQAHERHWAHQVHAGTNNLPASNPLPLESLAQKYPRMNIVMIHCWPYLKEAGYLARSRPNMSIDTCWMPVLNPNFLSEALEMWLNYVPGHKIMLGHDSTSIEMAVGSSLFTREILSEKLGIQQKKLQLPDPELLRIGSDLLHNNAVRLYGIGNEVIPA
jgi:predicted TIM-barrel fold metal-dependent hydrolase